MRMLQLDTGCTTARGMGVGAATGGWMETVAGGRRVAAFEAGTSIRLSRWQLHALVVTTSGSHSLSFEKYTQRAVNRASLKTRCTIYLLKVQRT